MTTMEIDLAISSGKKHSTFFPFLLQDESEENLWKKALSGMKDIASFDHQGACLSMHLACPRSHLQLVQVFLDRSAHQNLELLILVSNCWWSVL